MHLLVMIIIDRTRMFKSKKEYCMCNALPNSPYSASSALSSDCFESCRQYIIVLWSIAVNRCVNLLMNGACAEITFLTTEQDL